MNYISFKNNATVRNQSLYQRLVGSVFSLMTRTRKKNNQNLFDERQMLFCNEDASSYQEIRDSFRISTYVKCGNGPNKAIYIPGQSAKGVDPRAVQQRFDLNKWSVFAINSLGTFPNRPNFLQKTSHITLTNLLMDIDEVIKVELGYSKPFTICGNSIGASLALEVAKRIKEPSLINNIVLDSPFFSTNKEFENGFYKDRKIGKYCQEIGRGYVFDNFLNNFPEKNRNNWQDMAEFVYTNIHNGNVGFMRDFVKLHNLAIVSPEKVDKSFQGIDKAIKFTPKLITAHAISLIHYIANAGYLTEPNGALSGIDDDLFNKIYIACGEKDIIAPVELGVDELISRDKSILNRIKMDEGAHNDWQIRNPNVRQITDMLTSKPKPHLNSSVDVKKSAEVEIRELSYV